MPKTSLLTSFDTSSTRCLTRQEECLLRTAVAMVIVKKRCQERKKQRRTICSRVEALFALPPPTTTLLQKPLPDHMDHLLQVACRSEGPILKGVANHLVQQLQSWLVELLSSPASISRRPTVVVQRPTTGTDTLSRSISGPCNEASQLAPIHEWLTRSLLSHTTTPEQQGTASCVVVHCAMMHETEDKRLLQCWWHVLVTLIYRVDQGTLPEAPSSSSIDHFAVMLLNLLQTLSFLSPPGPRILQTNNLKDLLLPLPTPTNLSVLHWTMANDTNIPRHKLMLSPAGKLLLRLGLCRIFLLQEVPESSFWHHHCSEFPRNNDPLVGGLRVKKTYF